MFNFKDIPQLGNLLKEALQLKSKIDAIKEELVNVIIEGEVGGGLVKAKMNGKFELLSIEISDELLNKENFDKSLLEALITSAVNVTAEKVRDKVKEKMKEAAGGIEIPGLFD
ncbi:MAG: YbaB/EbfC family nucleoid-associated protein [Candidatus Hydrogenedentes bacterium]|nr:YbaB/EbfC family nucleoid-associated protein [Candidatus Hydrogenedentota bacterium]